MDAGDLNKSTIKTPDGGPLPVTRPIMVTIWLEGPYVCMYMRSLDVN